MYVRLTDEDKQRIEDLNALAHRGALGQSANFAFKLIADARMYGQLSDRQYPWVQKLIQRANQPEREKVEIGQLQGINALFEKAKSHLKSPAIVLSAGADADGVPYLVRLTVAKPHHRMPGTINVTEHDDTKEWSELLWYGRILKDGHFEISPKVSADQDSRENANFIVGQLKAFANDPVGVATAHGKLTGRCCFCHIALKDERSTAVGYGRTCAENWGLAWGARPVEFAESAANEARVAKALAAGPSVVPAPPKRLQSRRNIKLRA
jgi:hypothetical protein